MKIGIMSMQRVCNYGSFMQAYGLKKTIESLGHEVVFVDYRPGKTVTYNSNKVSYYKSIIRNSIMNIAENFIGVLFFASEEQKYSLLFSKEYKRKILPLLGISSKHTYNTKVDILVIGSDEVFNCLQSNPDVGFSEELFGKNNNAKKHISYAASFGNTTLDGLEKNNKKDIVKSLLRKFTTISVRDKNSYDIVESLISVKPEINLDPVLIYDFSKDIKKISYKEEYIVVYAYRNRITKEEKKAIQDFARKNGLKIYGIGGYQDFCDKNILGSPFEMLGYIKNASYVITDTFHGTIFSIITERKFATFIRKGHGMSYGNYEKLMDLLLRLNLTERIAFSSDELEKRIKPEIAYDEVKKIIQSERIKTHNYLKMSLQ